MERDWIAPEPHGIERIGTDEDLIERVATQPDFEGEFGERVAAEALERETTDEAGPIERESPDEAGPR